MEPKENRNKNPVSRDRLESKLKKHQFSGWNMFGIGIFRSMNWLMKRENQPITEDHYNVLVHSLTKERLGLFRTLWAENDQVMESQGNTCGYRAGKYGVHYPIYAARYALGQTPKEKKPGER